MPSTDTDETVRMTKDSWDLQQTLNELAVWRTWSEKTLNEFQASLKNLQGRRRLPADDVGNITLVMTKIAEILKVSKELDSPLHKATGQRIRKSRKA